MRLYSLLACVLAAFVLSSCSSPPPKKPKKTDESSSESKTTNSAPAATETKTESSEAKADEPKKEEPKPVESVKAPAEPAKEIKPAAKEAAAKFGPASGHEGEQVGGKTIQTWVNELMTDDKTKIVDALAALQMAGKWSSMAIPRVEQLTKHSDKEIADAAAETLKAIK